MSWRRGERCPVLQYRRWILLTSTGLSFEALGSKWDCRFMADLATIHLHQRKAVWVAHRRKGRDSLAFVKEWLVTVSFQFLIRSTVMALSMHNERRAVGLRKSHKSSFLSCLPKKSYKGELISGIQNETMPFSVFWEQSRGEGKAWKFNIITVGLLVWDRVSKLHPSWPKLSM